jgi:hypothetical protein
MHTFMCCRAPWVTVFAVAADFARPPRDVLDAQAADIRAVFA